MMGGREKQTKTNLSLLFGDDEDEDDDDVWRVQFFISNLHKRAQKIKLKLTWKKGNIMHTRPTKKNMFYGFRVPLIYLYTIFYFFYKKKRSNLNAPLSLSFQFMQQC